MAEKRKVEVFSAGCACCDDTVRMVEGIACESCDVTVLDMADPSVADRARELGVRSVPAVAVNGVLAGCCAGRGPAEADLRAAGVGSPAARG
jgi:glutaredoxin 3